MSRGPGAVQKAVLDHLDGEPDATTFETLRWALWERSGDVPIAPDSDLPNKWNTSVMRAVKGLESAKRVDILRRRLVSLEECVAHFPGKTLSGPVRQLRCQLLPVLLRWTQEGHAHPRYSSAANEKFHLASLTPDARRALRTDWLRLEPRLIEQLPLLERADRNAVFLLIAKGKSIFETQDLQCLESFGEHLRHCAKRQALPDALAADAMALSDGMLSPADAGHLQLRSYVHTFAHVPQHRGCSLKKETVEYLDKTCPEVVRSLPGYVAPPKPVRQMYAYAGPRDPKHSPRLYGLFDQTVFQEFHFLRVA